MFYAICRIIGLITGYPIQLLLFKRKTYYEDKKNTHLHRGGKLIISNHYNFLDYVLASFVVFPRKLNVVAGEVPFRVSIVRLGMKFFGAIQANRETKNMGFVDESAKIIRKGQLVQIFPEGRNTPDGKIHEFKKSYIVIAYRAGAPIVPVISDGNFGLFKRTHVIIGKEIDVSQFITSNRHTPTREELDRANEYIHNKVLELREELERRKKGRKKK